MFECILLSGNGELIASKLKSSTLLYTLKTNLFSSEILIAYLNLKSGLLDLNHD